MYTRGLPAYLRARPASVGFYHLAAGFAAAGTTLNVDDRHLTSGLLSIAGVSQASQASQAVGFSTQPERIAVPTGTLALWAAAWWYYRGAAPGDRTGE